MPVRSGLRIKKFLECNQGPINWADLAGRDCYSALDLSSIEDITVLSLFFPGPKFNDSIRIYFIPEDTVRERSKRDGVPYEMWAEQGLFELTPGNTVDYDYIRRRISGYYVMDGEVQHDDACIADHVNLKSLAYDRWNSSQLVNNLQADDIELSPFGQGFASMSAPTKQYMKMILNKEYNHGGDPVLRWMLSNVEIKRDAGGNEKPDKGKSKEKIDGVVADIMALGEYLTETDDDDEDMFTVLTA